MENLARGLGYKNWGIIDAEWTISSLILMGLRISIWNACGKGIGSFVVILKM